MIPKGKMKVILYSEDNDVGINNEENADGVIGIRIEGLEWYGSETLLGSLIVITHILINMSPP